jgi:CHAT domain-containing protein
MLASAHIDISQGVDASLLKRERSLEQSLTATSQRRIELLSQKHTEEQEAAVNREMNNLLGQYSQLKEEIRATSSAYAALTQPLPINLKDVQQKLLDPGALLLEYALGDQHSYLWAVTADSVNAYVLPSREKIERAATRVHSLLTAENQMARRNLAAKDYKKAAAALVQMILGPVAAQLSGKRLLIVADGDLEYIPLAALPDPAASAFKPLVLDHEIVNLPSAAVGVVLQQQAAERQPAPNALAVLADPVFDRLDPRVKPKRGEITYAPRDKAWVGSMNRQLSRSLADVNGGAPLQRLPYSRLEAEAILAAVPGKKLGALDFQANRTTATSPALAQYQIVHFATHGLLDNKRPELSGLVFSMVNHQGNRLDGFLDLADIYNLKLRADLVVLSACETGLGKQVKGEGLVGLTRGFMYAGATNVVASLWNVSDVATASLMEHFYRNLEQQGMAPSAALRSAQAALLKEKRWRSPYYWAGFQIYGEGRQVKPKPAGGDSSSGAITGR